MYIVIWDTNLYIFFVVSNQKTDPHASSIGQDLRISKLNPVREKGEQDKAVTEYK